mmetsp:Transcript_119381/g.315609  ORF Transcript_119381/g.315609 Transcript_119381/m.315609 type:complete len:223 (+) Transcript_119381:548-1216(+)
MDVGKRPVAVVELGGVVDVGSHAQDAGENWVLQGGEQGALCLDHARVAVRVRCQPRRVQGLGVHGLGVRCCARGGALVDAARSLGRRICCHREVAICRRDTDCGGWQAQRRRVQGAKVRNWWEVRGQEQGGNDRTCNEGHQLLVPKRVRLRNDVHFPAALAVGMNRRDDGAWQSVAQVHVLVRLAAGARIIIRERVPIVLDLDRLDGLHPLDQLGEGRLPQV